MYVVAIITNQTVLSVSNVTQQDIFPMLYYVTHTHTHPQLLTSKPENLPELAMVHSERVDGSTIREIKYMSKNNKKVI